MTKPDTMIPPGIAPRLLTVNEVADMLRCSPRIVAAWTASGDLASVKLGRLRRYRVADVEDFIRRNLSGTAQTPVTDAKP